MESYYRIVIIGGGPAGVSAGIKLQQHGIDCCIIDKAVFPRSKLCGGLITQKTINKLSELNVELTNERIIKFQTDRVNIDAYRSPISSFECSIPFTLVDRRELDNSLIFKYKSLGGKILEGIRVTHIDATSRSLALDNGQAIAYDILIGADGMTGISSSHVGNAVRSRAFGVETSIATDQLVRCPEGITLDIGYLPNGYVWIFPKGRYTDIGLACSYNRELDYVGILKRYISEKFRDGLEYKIKGAFLPYGRHSAKVAHKKSNMLLVGDAAGFIDCVTGEGLYFAVSSGMIAADTILANDSGGVKNLCVCYQKNCIEIINLVNHSARFMSFFYRNRELLLKVLKGHTHPLAFICDHQVSEYDYHFNFLKLTKDYFHQR